MTHFLRRLFSGAILKDATMSDLPNVSPNTDLPESAQAERAEILDLPATTPSLTLDRELTLATLADGVTRPLPPEAILAQTGNGHLAFSVSTDVGMVRTNNEDASFAFFSAGRSANEMPDFGIFIVADGMGGHEDGEMASAITTRTIATYLIDSLYMSMLAGRESDGTPISEALANAVERANAEVVANVPEGGTTVTATVIIGAMAYIAHVGDSRMYLIHKDQIEQLTRDHSLVQRLVELGQLSPEEASEHNQKSVLYRALGQNDVIDVDTTQRRLPPRSRVLLCSDGLSGYVNEKEILQVVRECETPQEASTKLVAMANMRGGIDNVTALILYLPG